MSQTLEKADRLGRYQRVLEALVGYPEFLREELPQLVPWEKKPFLIRLVGQLQREGWVDSDGAGHDQRYRWRAGSDCESLGTWIGKKVHGQQVCHSPQEERPRERLLAQGAGSLKLAELLAILIRVGQPGESAVQAGENLARHYADRLDQFAQAGLGELRAVSKVVGPAIYCQLMAAVELGRRVERSSRRSTDPVRITTPEQAVAFCESEFLDLMRTTTHEEFHIVLLNTKNQPMRTHRVSVGILDASPVHPREVFRVAIRESAKSLLLVHNHPSGDATPGECDVRVTERLVDSGKLIGIDVLDHIVLGCHGSRSMRQMGLGFSKA